MYTKINMILCQAIFFLGGGGENTDTIVCIGPVFKPWLILEGGCRETFIAEN